MNLNDTSYASAENSKNQQLLDVLPSNSVNTPCFKTLYGPFLINDLYMQNSGLSGKKASVIFLKDGLLTEL